MTAADRKRLSKLLGLLGSDHDGEVLNAAHAAHQFLQQRGLTWPDVITQGPQKREPQYSIWRETCRLLMERPGDLRAWEIGFVRDLPKFPRISTKQRYVLGEIAERVLKGDAS